MLQTAHLQFPYKRKSRHGASVGLSTTLRLVRAPENRETRMVVQCQAAARHPGVVGHGCERPGHGVWQHGQRLRYRHGVLVR